LHMGGQLRKRCTVPENTGKVPVYAFAGAGTDHLILSDQCQELSHFTRRGLPPPISLPRILPSWRPGVDPCMGDAVFLKPGVDCGTTSCKGLTPDAGGVVAGRDHQHQHFGERYFLSISE